MEIGTEGGWVERGFKVNESDIVNAGGVVRGYVNFGTGGVVESEAREVSDVEKRGVQGATDAVGFFRRGGGGADWDVIGVRELDRDAAELGPILLNDFLEVGEGLYFVE